MKKVLLIASSPNRGDRGNSDTLLENFKEGLEESGKVEVVKKQYLYDVCMGDYCHQLKIPNPENEQDLIELSELLHEIDGLVIATPTFNFNVPAVLKNFIDRIGYVALNYKEQNMFKQPKGQLGHLKCYFIVTGGTPNWIKRFIFFLYPDFWLKAVFAYYGCLKTKSSYSGKLMYSSPAKDKPKLLNTLKNKGKKFANWL